MKDASDPVTDVSTVSIGTPNQQCNTMKTPDDALLSARISETPKQNKKTVGSEAVDVSNVEIHTRYMPNNQFGEGTLKKHEPIETYKVDNDEGQIEIAIHNDLTMSNWYFLNYVLKSVEKRDLKIHKIVVCLKKT